MIGKKAVVIYSVGLFQKSLKAAKADRMPTANIYNRAKIGNRDWVAWGRTGQPYYADDILYPFPAVRFKENSNELLALREKEKGDWRKLTLEEKKILYRASFRQTFSELRAPTGQWKSIMGCVLIFVSFGLWFFILTKMFVLPPLPESFSEENRRKMLRFMLVNRDGFISGLSSKWDYELDDWKK